MDMPWLSFYEEGVPATLSYPDVPIDRILNDTARTYPFNTATNFILSYLLGGSLTVGGRLPYGKLDEYVNRLATALYQIGVRKGDRVAVMLPNSPQFVITFFAVVRLGAVVVNINPTYTSRELHYHLQDSEAETVVLLNLFWPRLREIQSDTPVRRVIVAYIYDVLPTPSRLLVAARQRRTKEWVRMKPEHNIFFFSRLLEKYGPTPPRVTINPDDTALFQYTGGTTGIPKAAILTHRNVLANTWQTMHWVPDRKPGMERVMGAIPFFHVYGLTIGMLLAVAVGAELVMVPNPRPIENVMRVLQKERCTIFPGVPAMYIGIVNNPTVQAYNLQSVRGCISGSAPLPMDVQEKFDSLTGGRLVEGYGLTEAAPVTHCNPLYGTRKAGSIGIPLPDVEARIVDMETGEAIPPGDERIGELCVRGPQVMKGYWKRPEETRSTLDDGGWLHTGDICRMDSDGYFFIVDRKKDIIITSGFKVLPRDVEEVLFLHPKVQEAVVAGIPNDVRGDESVKAYIVPVPGSSPTVEEMVDFCRLHLAPYKVPRMFEFRNELPKTMVGKVLRRALVEEEKARIARGEAQHGERNSSSAG